MIAIGLHFCPHAVRLLQVATAAGSRNSGCAARRLHLRWADRALFIWLYRRCPRILDISIGQTRGAALLAGALAAVDLFPGLVDAEDVTAKIDNFTARRDWKPASTPAQNRGYLAIVVPLRPRTAFSTGMTRAGLRTHPHSHAGPPGTAQYWPLRILRFDRAKETHGSLARVTTQIARAMPLSQCVRFRIS
jgi:hypothetical protein